MRMHKKSHRKTIKVLRNTIFFKCYDLWSIDKWCWLQSKECEASHTFKRKTVDLFRSYSVCPQTGIQSPLSSFTLPTRRDTVKWLAKHDLQIYSSYHETGNKNVQLVLRVLPSTNQIYLATSQVFAGCLMLSNYSLISATTFRYLQQSALLRDVWLISGIKRCCCRSRSQQSGDRTFARHLNNDTQYPKFDPVSELVSN